MSAESKISAIGAETRRLPQVRLGGEGSTIDGASNPASEEPPTSDVAVVREKHWMKTFGGLITAIFAVAGMGLLCCVILYLYIETWSLAGVLSISGLIFTGMTVSAIRKGLTLKEAMKDGAGSILVAFLLSFIWTLIFWMYRRGHA